MTTTIYALVEPDTGTVRYIGKTSKPLSHRLRAHHEDARSSKYRHTRKSRWIASLLRSGKVPGIRALETVLPHDCWRAAERRWIAVLRLQGLDLLNHTDGGDGVDGYKHTSETLAVLSARKLGKPPPNKGKPPSAASRAANSAAHLGIRHTEQAKNLAKSEREISASHG